MAIVAVYSQTLFDLAELCRGWHVFYSWCKGFVSTAQITPMHGITPLSWWQTDSDPCSDEVPSSFLDELLHLRHCSLPRCCTFC